MIRAIRNARPLGGHDPIDLAIDDGVISAIVPAGRLAAGDVAGESLELDGRWLMPGLWDEHVHVTQWAQRRSRLDVASADSAAGAAELVRTALRGADDAGADDVIVGTGFRDGLWPDAPTAAVLDAVVADRPLVLVSADVHCVWLNSAAMARFGVDPLDGVLREEAAFAVTALLDSAPDAALDRGVRRAAADAAARGVVGVVDLEMRWNRDDWLRRVEQGFDELRVEFGVYPHDLDRAIAAGMRSGGRLAGTVSVGPLKVVTDGSLNTRTAYCCDPYPGSTEQPYGRLNVPPCELQPLLARASEAGFTLAVHAIGDGANRLALDAFAAVGRGGRIEHAQLVHESDIPRFAALGVTASVQPEHALDDRDVAERFWPGRTSRSFPLRSLLDAGARIVLGSDAPVAPLDPWIAIAAATARTRDGREPFHAEQAITAAEALAASVRTRLAVGQPADLVALDADPLTADADVLRSMPVAHTLLGGRPTYGAAAERERAVSTA